MTAGALQSRQLVPASIPCHFVVQAGVLSRAPIAPIPGSLAIRLTGSSTQMQSKSASLTVSLAMCVARRDRMPNPAFESGRADKQRVFGLRPRRRAAQRER